MTNFWKKHGAHLIAYLMSSLVTVLGAVAHYGALLGPSAPHQVLMLVGVAGILLTAVHHIETLVASSGAPRGGTQAGGASVRFLTFLAALSFGLVAACSSLSGLTSNSASASAVQAAIDLAVGTAIQQTAKTAPAQAQEAQQIQQIAGALQGVLSGQSSTIGLLDRALEAKIVAARLPAAEAAAAATLVQTIQAVVLQQVQGGTSKLSPTQTVAINAVLDDVIQAASFYNVHAMAEMRADMAAEHAHAQAQEDELANANPVGLEASRTVSDRMERAAAVLTRINRREIALSTP